MAGVDEVRAEWQCWDDWVGWLRADWFLEHCQSYVANQVS